MKIVIIDDQEDSVEKLSFLLKKYCPTEQLAGVAHSGKEGIAMIMEIQPDLVFLDVEMDDMTGFEMLDRLDTVDFQVVFTTAFDKYAIKAIRSSALDYLLKPITKEELISAVQRAASEPIKIHTEQLKGLSSKAKDKNSKIERIALTTSDGLVFKNISDIIRCESDRNYTLVFLANKEKLVVSKTLKEIDEALDGSGFFRVHHSHLINLIHIDKYVKTDGGYVVMRTGEIVNVARNRKDEFLELFSKF